jgi:hypothetical protein
MTTGSTQKIRVVHASGVQTVHEGPLSWTPETVHLHGTHVATRSADGVWRYYSCLSDTPGWPVVSTPEAAAFTSLPEYRVGK